MWFPPPRPGPSAHGGQTAGRGRRLRRPRAISPLSQSCALVAPKAGSERGSRLHTPERKSPETRVRSESPRWSVREGAGDLQCSPSPPPPGGVQARESRTAKSQQERGTFFQVSGTSCPQCPAGGPGGCPPPRGRSGFPGLSSADPGPSARPSCPEPGICECVKVVAGSCGWTAAEGRPSSRKPCRAGPGAGPVLRNRKNY